MQVNPFGSGPVWAPANWAARQPQFGRFTISQQKDLLDMNIPNNLEEAVTKKLQPLTFMEKNLIKLIQWMLPDTDKLEKGDPFQLNAQLDPTIRLGQLELERAYSRKKLVETSMGLARLHTLLRLSPTFALDDKTFETFKSALNTLKKKLSLS